MIFTYRFINGLVFGIFATRTWVFSGEADSEGLRQKQTIVVSLGPVELSFIF